LLDLVLAGSLCRARYPSPGAVDVHAHFLRKKLAPHGIKVVSVHGHGYRLSGEDRARLQNMIEQVRAA
jgi:DNA-binding response OmpR family regulator